MAGEYVKASVENLNLLFSTTRALLALLFALLVLIILFISAGAGWTFTTGIRNKDKDTHMCNDVRKKMSDAQIYANDLDNIPSINPVLL